MRHAAAIGVLLGLTFCLLASAEEAIKEAPICATDRDHWAYRPIARPKLPKVKRTEWERGGIDAFILAPMEAKGLAPAPEAERLTLLRRISFGLTGLPPSREELAAFETDTAPDVYERQVDRLLASPAYGERWGQHWLDLARFAETDGFEHDKTRPEAWKYRDWVIAALNADLPYDRFVTAQLAGDEIEPGLTVATMFCLSGPDMPDINDQLERRHSLMNELTSTVGSVFLGLQLGCAQCHDHKYDPLSQGDFYRLRAVFESAVPPLKRDAPVSVLKHQPRSEPALFWIRGDHRRPGSVVPPGFPRVVPSEQALPSSPRRELGKWLFQESHPLTARVIVNRLWQHLFGRGIFGSPSDVGVMGSSPTHPELLDYLASELREGGWGLKRLQRTLLASATYRQASIASGEAGAIARLKTLDPDNRLYTRFPRQRLEGEAIRDALLTSAGLISSERGGLGVMPPLPEELIGTLLKGQWKTSQRQADHYRRSIYLFARRNLRYPLLEAFDKPDANASCPSRNRSTTAPQSLVLLNSELSLLAARHLAGRVLTESPDSKSQIDLLYQLSLARHPTAEESQTLEAFLAQQRAALAGEARVREKLALPIPYPEERDFHLAAALVDASLALFNTSEFLYCD